MKTNKAGKYMLTTPYAFGGVILKNKLTDFCKCDLENVNDGLDGFHRPIRLFTVMDGKIVRIKANGAKWNR